ncbi:chemotaxis protein CheW [Methanothermococcus okinawensis]|uniref:Chemotaxis protein CheA n=1 Tax=Methanothermococcus okinawensis (strain DSM 14208 / JCM 11175 / IH1) TaxID=647113 RepID=F8AK23_METOI|nr:chemotaxis protein CheW [Methanothermococcus okinawensis]AEH07384.1 CheA signal transduction histidine kinase [Methanothermococcus okinawensis IH1]
MDEMEQYKELFMAEATEHLEALNQNLVELENNPDNKDIINLIFRSAHTLKGSARTLGFDNISNLTHHMEDILDNIRNGEIAVNSEIMDLLFKCLDALETMVNEIEEDAETSSIDVDSIVNEIKTLKEKYMGNGGSSASEASKSNVNISKVAENEESKKENNNTQNTKSTISIVLKEPKTTVNIKTNLNDEKNEGNENEIKKPKNLDEILSQMSKSVEVLNIVADAFNYDDLKETLTKINDLVNYVLNEDIIFNKSVMEALKCSLDAMEKIAKSFEENGGIDNLDIDLSKINKKIDDAITLKHEHRSSSDNVKEYGVILDHSKFDFNKYAEHIKEMVDNGYTLYHLKSKVLEDCDLKSVRLSMVISNIKKIGDILISTPSEEEIKEKSHDELEIIFLSNKQLDEITKVFDTMCEMEYIAVAPINIDFKIGNIGGVDEGGNNNETVKDDRIKDAYKLKIIIDEECILKSVRAYMAIKELKNVGEIIKTEPSCEKLQEGEFDGNEVVVYIISNKEEDDLKEIVFSIPEIKNVIIETPEYLKEQSKMKKNSKPHEKSSTSTKPQNSKKKPSEKSGEKKTLTQTVRINIEKLDKLMNLVGELVINRANFTQIANKYNIKELHNAVNRLNMLATELQEEVMAMRMIPVSFIFNRFPRTVRDTSKALNKEVELIIEGSDIELDRTVLDELAEPLTHIIRNSLDHGIETPEEREKKGKPRKGTLKLVATRERNHVLITIEDDGKGIDPEIIKKKAVEKGIISEDDANKLSDQEAINLVFLPGFSTAEKVSDVSGRGVGMDVVKSKIESLGGSVSLYSEKEKGTKIILQLPLTMAIILALLIKLRDQVYAIPLTSVLDVTHVKKEDISNLEGQDAIIYRNHILPVIWLRDILNDYSAEESEDVYIIVIERNSGKLGVVVDDVIGREEIVVKPLTGILKNIHGLAGATILGDGRVALILDLNNI